MVTVALEESDSCGELPSSSASAGGQSAALGIHQMPSSGEAIELQPTAESVFAKRRSSEFYPAARPHMMASSAAPFGRQVRRDRRLSDPGRLAVPLLRLNLHHQQQQLAAAQADFSSNGGGSPLIGTRLSDPRLAAIRSLFSSGPCEVGEALAPPPLSPTSARRLSRSRSPTSPSDFTSQLQQRHARCDTRRLSLPNPQVQSHVSASRSPLSTAWLLPTEVNEAMGAVSGSPSIVTAGVSFPLSGSASGATDERVPSSAVTASSTGGLPFSMPLLSGSTALSPTPTLAMRRRRSVSLDQSGVNAGLRLEAITEENQSAGGIGGAKMGPSGAANAFGFLSARKSSSPHMVFSNSCDRN